LTFDLFANLTDHRSGDSTDILNLWHYGLGSEPTGSGHLMLGFDSSAHPINNRTNRERGPPWCETQRWIRVSGPSFPGNNINIHDN
jgi:hypothetical protein